MAQENVNQREEVDLLLYALTSIATESTEPDIVRLALIALYETPRGRAHLSANPIKI